MISNRLVKDQAFEDGAHLPWLVHTERSNVINLALHVEHASLVVP